MSVNQKIQRIYEIRENYFSRREYDKICSLFKKEGENSNISSEFLDWQYSQNPMGKAVGFNAFFEDKLIAHYVAIPVKCMVFGKESMGLLSINTRTDREHQGEGLFTRLAEATYSRAKQLGFEFVIGVANNNSVFGFTKKLEFQHVGLLETRMVFNICLKNNLPPVNFSRIWDEDSIAWRLRNPRAKYFFRCLDKTTFLYGESRHFQALIGRINKTELPNEIKPINVSLNPLKLWIGIDSEVDWGKSVNLKIPESFRSVSLNLIYRDLTGTRQLNPDQVKFWSMDFDAY